MTSYLQTTQRRPTVSDELKRIDNLKKPTTAVPEKPKHHYYGRGSGPSKLKKEEKPIDEEDINIDVIEKKKPKPYEMEDELGHTIEEKHRRKPHSTPLEDELGHTIEEKHRRKPHSTPLEDELGLTIEEKHRRKPHSTPLEDELENTIEEKHKKKPVGKEINLEDELENTIEEKQKNKPTPPYNVPPYKIANRIVSLVFESKNGNLLGEAYKIQKYYSLDLEPNSYIFYFFQTKEWEGNDDGMTFYQAEKAIPQKNRELWFVDLYKDRKSYSTRANSIKEVCKIVLKLDPNAVISPNDSLLSY